MDSTATTAEGNQGGPDVFSALSKLVNQVNHSRDPNLINASIYEAHEVLALASATDQASVEALNALACLHFGLFKTEGSPEELETSLRLMEQAQDAPASISLQNALNFSTMSNHLVRLFQHIRVTRYLEIGIAGAKAAIKARPDAHPDLYFKLVFNLSVAYEKLYSSSENSNVEQRISWAEEALLAIPEGHPSRARHLVHLSAFLEKWFLDGESDTPAFDTLNKAIHYAFLAVEAMPPQHIDYIAAMENLVNRIEVRYERLSESSDIDILIHWYEKLTFMCPAALSKVKAEFFNKLGYWYYMAHKTEHPGSQDTTRAINPIDQAIRCWKTADQLADAGDVEKMNYKNNYIDGLRIKFETAGAFADGRTQTRTYLDEAIDVGKAALQDMPQHERHLVSLASVLARRYQYLGAPGDISEAIRLGEREVAAFPVDVGDKERAAAWINLANYYGFRFEKTLDSRDVEEAIRLTRLAVDATSQGHPELGSRWNTLGRWFGQKYSRTGDPNDLQSAIACGQKAVTAIPKGSPQKPQHLNNLAIWLGLKYEMEGGAEGGADRDLNDATSSLRTAISTTEKSHTDYVRYLNNLGKFLAWRYRKLQLDDDIEEAIKLGRQAEEAKQPHHPERSRHLSNLAEMYRLRHDKYKDPADEAAIISILREIPHLNATPPTHRINGIMENIEWLRCGGKWLALSEVTEAAVALLPLVSTRSLTQKDQQGVLRRYANLTSMAVASALQAGKPHNEAARLLENGRAVISTLQFDVRSDLSELKATEHAHLAADFERLRDELNFLPEASSEARTSSQQHMVSQMLDDKITEIRCLGNFENFLRPPDSDHLKKAAGPDGAIVFINVSFRNDALVILRDSITVCRLRPEVQIELDREVKSFTPRRADISKTLQWLWDAIAEPVLQHLDITEARRDIDDILCWPRVCWIPTGTLCMMPLHAAGYHFDGSNRTVLDRVVSSYSPSVKALLYAQQNMARQQEASTTKQALLICMPETRGISDLEFAEEERDLVQNVLTRDKAFLCQPLESPDRDTVMAALPGSDTFHFAGHGLTDPADPSESGLVLHDGVRLTVTHLRSMMLHRKPPFLAYLSACSTGQNRDRALQDEGIHLMGACQIAGFQNVVGSLWAVSDSKCLNVARVVYETIVKDMFMDCEKRASSVARGLHLAVRELRIETRLRSKGKGRRGELVDSSSEDEQDIWAGDASLWAAFVHVGFGFE
jgi:tetratricopeptide (TPR) repeat protein